LHHYACEGVHVSAALCGESMCECALECVNCVRARARERERERGREKKEKEGKREREREKEKEKEKEKERVLSSRSAVGWDQITLPPSLYAKSFEARASGARP